MRYEKMIFKKIMDYLDFAYERLYFEPSKLQNLFEIILTYGTQMEELPELQELSELPTDQTITVTACVKLNNKDRHITLTADNATGKVVDVGTTNHDEHPSCHYQLSLEDPYYQSLKQSRIELNEHMTFHFPYEKISISSKDFQLMKKYHAEKCCLPTEFANLYRHFHIDSLKGEYCRKNQCEFRPTESLCIKQFG